MRLDRVGTSLGFQGKYLREVLDASLNRRKRSLEARRGVGSFLPTFDPNFPSLDRGGGITAERCVPEMAGCLSRIA